jgi:tetraacyldisaccharide 4'-kinase
MSMSWLERVWYGDSTQDAATRAVLWPFAQAYGGIVELRARLYARGVLAQENAAVPTIAVGNLTAGGTGKTPLAAYLVAELANRGAKPGIVLRGYGNDETEVHRRLNANVPVIASANRVSGIELARRQGADVVVLDDAFQHRQVRRTADVLLLSAEQMLRPRRLLPSGPWREPLEAARRADLIIITRKAADAASAQRAVAMARAAAPDVPVAVIHLAPTRLNAATGGESLALDRLRDARVLAIAAIGEPRLFAQQLEALGARVTLSAFRDHHPFTDGEVAALARQASECDFVVSTLKDAVKLGSRWPGPSRLWYVSQQPVVEQGVEHMHKLLQRVLDARSSAAPSAG